jgi:hypothetical protein
VIAVGGDGSLNTVAQAAHAAGCPMGVIPYGTFNYFARLLPRYCAHCDGCACISRQVPRFATCRPLTLFVGNNRLQLQQFGAEPEDTLAGTPGDGSMSALILRPVGTLSMTGLMLHGAMGRLGEAAAWRAGSAAAAGGGGAVG